MFALLLAIWKTPTGETLRGELEPKVREQGHFGPILKTYILYQYYHCHVTQPLLLEQLREWGLDISSARHQGINSYCTQIGNEWFATKSRTAKSFGKTRATTS